MGWKASFIVIKDRGCPSDYFRSPQNHLPDRATEFISHLTYRGFSKRLPTKLDLNPKSGDTIIGAYERALIYADTVVFDCAENKGHELIQNAVGLHPEASVLMLILHSGVNEFGYSIFENGSLIREYSGDIDHGIRKEFGQPLVEEKPDFDRSKIIRGERVFFPDYGPNVKVAKPNPRTLMPLGTRPSERSATAYGETLAFKVAKRFFGQELDRFAAHEQSAELFPAR